MEIKIMKKSWLIFWISGLMAGALVACSSGGTEDPSIPAPPEVSIVNRSEITTCLPGDTISLEAKLDNPPPTSLKWQVDKQEVSTGPAYRFTSPVAGTFEIVLTATNKDGAGADTLLLEVTGERFRVSDIRHWAGEGENSSVLAIQWVSGENLLEPADEEVFFIAWGYRWDSVDKPTGADMLRDIAKHDPRLYVALSGDYVAGFGYDGDNDGRIELQSSALHLSQEDFIDGVYEIARGDFDGLKPVASGDYWIGGTQEAYTSYWIGVGEVIPLAGDFEYSQAFMTSRRLENLSWDVWTLSPIHTSLTNTYPIPHLIKAAEANS